MSGRRGATAKRRVVSDPVAGLASIPAGPGLSAALSQLDLTRLSGYELVLVLRARYRQDSHERGMLLATVAEVLRRSDPEHGADLPDEATWRVRSSELRTALVLTRRAADSLAGIARTTQHTVPALGAAMRRGVLDQPRARVFQDGTLDLCQRHAAAVVAALLPQAPGMTTGELFAAIQEMAIELDPDWARRRYERVRRTRHVTAVINHDGTATMAGHNLPADEVAAAADRLDALAARVKTAGHPATLAQLRADIFLGRLDRYAALTDDELFDQLTNPIPDPEPDPEPFGFDPYEDDEDDGEDDQGDDEDAEGQGDEAQGQGHEGRSSEDQGDEPTAIDASDEDSPGDLGQDGPGDVDDGGDGDEPGGDDCWPGSVGGPCAPGGGNAEPGPEQADETTQRETTPDDAPADEAGSDVEPHDEAPRGEARPDGTGQDHGRRGRDAGGVGPRARGRGVHLLIGLGTLAGLDRGPAQLLGFGHLHAELARRVTAAPGAAWYVALVNPDGSPVDVFPIRTRPSRIWWDGPAPAYRHPEIWLHLTPAELMALIHDPPPGWEKVIATIASRVHTHPGGPPNGDPTRRLPSDPLRRWLWVRDRRCAFPGCRIAPHRTQPDHTMPYAAGGQTSDRNLASACGPDHDLRHEHGWHVHQPRPGHLVWTSPLGHAYHRLPPPGPGLRVGPMPQPVRPDETNRHLIQAHEHIPCGIEETCKIVRDPPPPKPQPPPAPAPKPQPREDDEPPF